MNTVTTFIVSVLLTLLVLAMPGRAATYSNPVSTNSGADPSVLYHNGTYYFYSTNSSGAVYTSSDLMTWKKGPVVIPDGYTGAWAPDVSYNPDDGKFYLHLTKDYYLHVAVSDAPDKKFTYVKQVFLNALDSHIFRDDDGSVYLYFVRVPGSILYGAKMADYTTISGPFVNVGQPDTDWELHEAEINEGPWMVKHDGKYFLMYSGSDAKSKYYAVGLAIADSPLGPFTKYANNPVFEDLANDIYGPGHGSVTRDKEGTLWHLYHQKPDDSISWNRYVCLDKLYWDGQGILRGTPTNGTTQQGPVMDASLAWSPDIWPRGGSSDGSCTVTLTCNTAGADIRYTTDGTDPDASSALYTGAFDISSSCTVKARAFKAGLTTSTVTAQPYTVTGSGIRDLYTAGPDGMAAPDKVYDISGRAHDLSAAGRLSDGLYLNSIGGQTIKYIHFR